MVLYNFTKRHHNGLKMGTSQLCNTFEVRKPYFKLDSCLQSFRSVTFPYNSLYTCMQSRILSLGNPVAQLTSAAVKLYSLTHGDSKITKFKMHQNLRNLEHSKTLRLGLRQLNLRWKPGVHFVFWCISNVLLLFPRLVPLQNVTRRLSKRDMVLIVVRSVTRRILTSSIALCYW